MKGSKDTGRTHINFSYFRSLNLFTFENKRKIWRHKQKRSKGTWILRE